MKSHPLLSFYILVIFCGLFLACQNEKTIEKDGKKTAGRILSETEETITIMPNPYSSTFTTKLDKSTIEKQELSPISPMPPGLFNRLNEQEVADVMAYLLSEEETEL